MDVFHTLAEISVAIAGFSSLIIVLRGSSSEWRKQDYIGLGYVLGWSVGAIFLSLLPIVLGEFGVDVASASRVSLMALPTYMIGVGALLGYIRRSLYSEPEAAREPFWRSAMGPGAVGVAMTVSALSITALCVLAATSLLPGASHAWLALAIVLMMAHAVAEMGIFVLRSNT